MTDSLWVDTIEAHDGLLLYCQVYESPAPLAVLLTVHDYGQHSGTYAAAHERMLKQGYNVYTLDLRGHGKSPGERAAIDQFDDFLDDIDLLYARMQDRERDRPVFLMGQGMGSHIALRYAMTRKPSLNGLILCGGLPELPLTAKERLISQYAALLLPRVEANADARALLLSPALDGALKDDALAFRGAVKAKTVIELNAARMSANEVTPLMTFPVLCLSSEKQFVAMERLSENILSHDKTILPFAGHSHHLLLGSGRDLVMDGILNWCADHLEKIEDEEWDEGEDDSL